MKSPMHRRALACVIMLVAGLPFTSSIDKLSIFPTARLGSDLRRIMSSLFDMFDL